MIPWLIAFILTQAVEVPLYIVALRPRRSAALIAFGASLLTHPLIWAVFPYLPWSYWTTVIVVEGFAVTTEALYLHLFGLHRALLWSLLANMASAGLGFLLRGLGVDV